MHESIYHNKDGFPYIASISNRSEALYLYEFNLRNSASASHEQETIKCNYQIHGLLRAPSLCTLEGLYQTNKLFVRIFVAVESIHVPEGLFGSRRVENASDFSPTLATILYGDGCTGTWDHYNCEEKKEKHVCTSSMHFLMYPTRKYSAYKNIAP